jgi:WD40 repeat protein
MKKLFFSLLLCLIGLGSCQENQESVIPQKPEPKTVGGGGQPKPSFADLVPVEVMRHGQAATHVAFSPDGRWLVSTGKDRLIRIWDAQNPASVRKLAGHKAAVNMASFSPDSLLLVSASADESARIWKVSTGRMLNVLREKPSKNKKGKGTPDEEEPKPPAPRVNWASFSKDGRQVITASDDFALRLWDVNTGKLMGKFTDMGCRQRRVYPRRDAPGWVSSSGCLEDGVSYLKFWDEKGNQIGVFGNKNQDAHFLAFDRQDRYLVSADGSAILTIYSVQGTFLKKVMLGGYHFCIVFGPDDETLLVGADRGEIFVYETGDFKRVGRLSVKDTSAVDSLALNPVDNSLAVALRNGLVLRFGQPCRLGP